MCDALQQLVADAKDKQTKKKKPDANAPRQALTIDGNAGSHRPSGQLTRKEIMDQLT